MSIQTSRAALIALATAAAAASTPAVAHPGGLAADGCHNDRRTGTRHCHGGGAPAPRTRPAEGARLTGAPAGGRAFRNCAEARAAGAAPVYRGDPGYGPHLDRDNDGVGCERG